MPNLKIRDAGKEYTRQIENEAIVLGRGETNDIDIEDSKASKEHCRIERVGQRWKLVDLESKNGTKVNGEFKNKAWLGHGDVVQIGAAELRFGLEAAARTSATRRPAPDALPEDEEGQEEEELPRRRRKSNLPLILGVAVPVGVGILILLINLIAGTSVNKTVLARSKRLVEEGRYGDAILYAEQNGDNSKSDYVIIERFLEKTRDEKVQSDRNERERQARELESKVGNYILSYNRGHLESGPTQILPLMKRFREEFADTDAAARVKAAYPAWYAGKTPERATDLLTGSGLQKAWEAAVARSEQYRKDNTFREARETIDRFISEREVGFTAEQLATYKELRDQEVMTIDRLAESKFRGRQAEAERLLKAKKYDEAIDIYQAIVEKYGIDTYVRQAQAEIVKIKALKAGGK